MIFYFHVLLSLARSPVTHRVIRPKLLGTTPSALLSTFLHSTEFAQLSKCSRLIWIRVLLQGSTPQRHAHFHPSAPFPGAAVLHVGRPKANADENPGLFLCTTLYNSLNTKNSNRQATTEQSTSSLALSSSVPGRLYPGKAWRNCTIMSFLNNYRRSTV